MLILLLFVKARLSKLVEEYKVSIWFMLANLQAYAMDVAEAKAREKARIVLIDMKNRS